MKLNLLWIVLIYLSLISSTYSSEDGNDNISKFKKDDIFVITEFKTKSPQYFSICKNEKELLDMLPSFQKLKVDDNVSIENHIAVHYPWKHNNEDYSYQQWIIVLDDKTSYLLRLLKHPSKSKKQKIIGQLFVLGTKKEYYWVLKKKQEKQRGQQLSLE